MTDIIERQRARVYAQKAQKIAKRFYIQKSRHFSKIKTISVTFYIQKAIHLTLKDFHEIFEVGIYIQKSWHFAFRDVLIYKNSGTFVWRDFSLIFWNLRRGGTFIYKKNHVLCVTFLYWKTMHFALGWQYALHFNIQKTIHFSLRLYLYNLLCGHDT